MRDELVGVLPERVGPAFLTVDEADSRRPLGHPRPPGHRPRARLAELPARPDALLYASASAAVEGLAGIGVPYAGDIATWANELGAPSISTEPEHREDVGKAAQWLADHLEALELESVEVFPTAGAPVVYGGFTSNVDMRSGAPAFGTPENAKATIAGGQLARRYGLLG